jgi:hypothetical protein
LLNTNVKLDFQTSGSRNSFEAVTPGGSWVKARELRDSNAFSQLVVRLNCDGRLDVSTLRKSIVYLFVKIENKFWCNKPSHKLEDNITINLKDLVLYFGLTDN